uniref:Uncharacterized protein n=1 Tax=Brassica campestris TaxID=3711 RepID=M4EGU5_BRACM
MKWVRYGLRETASKDTQECMDSCRIDVSEELGRHVVTGRNARLVATYRPSLARARSLRIDRTVCMFGSCVVTELVRRDVRQGVHHKVLHHIVVSNKPKVVHQCTNMKVGHKKVECFARENSRNMGKKVNKTFTKPKRLEEVSLAKSGLPDEIKEETSEEGCSSGRSELEVDQGASSLEAGHEVVCGTKGKEIEYRECISHGGENHGVVHISWGRKSHFVWKFPGEEHGCNVVAEPEDCHACSAHEAKRGRLKITIVVSPLHQQNGAVSSSPRCNWPPISHLLPISRTSRRSRDPPITVFPYKWCSSGTSHHSYEAVRCENDEGNRRIWWSWFNRRESDKGRKLTRRWIWRPGSRRRRRNSDHRSHGRAEEVLQRKEE